MKDIILKIAGVKDEQSFYKKFPTEEAFMKKHGSEFQKAQKGAWIETEKYKPAPIQLKDYDIDANQIKIDKERKKAVKKSLNSRHTAQFGLTQGLSEAYSTIAEEQAGFNLPNIDDILNPKPYADNTNVSDIRRSVGMVPQAGEIGKGNSKFDINKIAKYAPAAGKLVQGFQALKDEKRLLDQTKQMRGVSNVMLEASRTRPEVIERDYIRPEDNIVTGEELFPVYGTSAKNGKKVKAQWGDFSIKNFAESGGQDLLSNIITGIGGENAGGDIGGTIGKTVGNIVGGPVGGLVLGGVGQIAGALINRRPNQIKKNRQAIDENISQMMAQNSFMGLQDQNFSHMEHGGKVNPHMEKDGELEVLWGGKAKPISYNPYLPGKGETVMFTGQAHDESSKGNSGIGITYGNNPVEVEGGEPAVKINNKGEEGLVIFGNLKIPKGFDSFIGDTDAKGKKFKNYVEMLSKKESKQNKIIDKNLTEVAEMEIITSEDKLGMNSRYANLLGADMSLKTIASRKQRAAEAQSIINSEAERMGVSADSLAKGKPVKVSDNINSKKAQWGEIIGHDEKGFEIMNQAQYDYLRDLYRQAAKSNDPKIIEQFQKTYHQIAPKRALEILGKSDATNFGKLHGYTNQQLESNEDSIFGYRTEQYLPFTEGGDSNLKINQLGKKPNIPDDVTEINDPGYKRSALLDAFGQVLPFIRPSDAEPLDPNQLLPEMYALANNQLEPVQAQTYSPELNTPYRISLQDIMNENQADYRAAQRNTGYNPAAQAFIAGEKYAANQKVLGEEFRMNQEMADRTYRENRATLNDAELKNLGIYDQQYTRSAQAKANTKATTLEALKSVTDKELKNKAANKTLQAYENLYNYRYDNRGRAINWNAPFQAEIPTVGTIPTDDEGNVITDIQRVSQRVDKHGLPQGAIKTNERKIKTESKNGGILKLYKDI